MAYRRNGAAVAVASVALPAIDTEREFDFTDADFQSLVKLAHGHAGISLAESKRNLVYSRLSRRLRTLGLRSFQDYRDYLAANSGELESFINAISTNLTKFFREAHHFEHLRTHDAIFCRNVMIYFDAPTKSTLIDRFAQQLHPDGWLYIGHSESLIGSHPKLDLVGRTTYRRVQ